MIYSLQFARGVAALLVAFGHFPEGLMTGPLAYLKGAIGVDLFFVISGFVMSLTIDSRRSNKGWPFLLRRILRIYPTYIIASVMVAGTYFLLFEVEPVWWHFFSSLLLFPVSDETGVLVYPYIAAAWTLSFEMYFYLVMAILLALRICSALTLTLTLASLVFIGLFLPRGTAWIDLVTSSINFEFLFGAWIYELWKKYPSIFAVVWKPSLITGVISVAMLRGAAATGHEGAYGGLSLVIDVGDGDVVSVLRAFGWGVPCALLTMGILGAEGLFRRVWIARLATLLGNASYPLYVTHYFLITVLQAFFSMRSIAWVPALAIVILVFAIAFYKFLERPAISFLSRIVKVDGTSLAQLSR